MPVTFDRDNGILILRMVGSYQPADIHDALVTGLAKGGSADVVGLLFDVSASESLGRRSPEDIQKMAIFLGKHRHAFRSRAALLAKTDLAYAFMRMGSVRVSSEGVTTEVFRDESAARQWLALAPGP
ncbi:MAG: hypothetical protein NVS1B4_25460 [Gemmatimonadaceae bacterium]